MSGSAPQGGNDTTYVCVNISGTVLFTTALLDNDKLTTTSVSYTFISEGMMRMYLFIYDYVSVRVHCIYNYFHL